MIPPQPPEGSDNELTVYEILKDCPGTGDWIVLHQLNFAKHVSQARGEADFIVFVPEVGVVFLEVKGYARCENGQWFFGRDPEGKRSPFAQASGAMDSIRDWVDDQQEQLKGIPLCSGAVFVQTVWSVPIPDIFPHQLIDATKVDARHPEMLRDAIVNLISNERLRLEQPPTRLRFREGRPSSFEVDEFVELLRPTVHPPEHLINVIWAKVELFTDRQLKALDECKTRRQLVFKGLAGTGKTVIATQLAIQESNRNRVLYVCFTQLARENLENATRDLATLHVRGIFELSLDLIGATEGNVAHKEWSSRLYADKDFAGVLAHAIEVASRLPDDLKYDLLIVDEAQDVLDELFIGILGAWLKGGLEEGRWVLFLDQNQSVFSDRHLTLEAFLQRYGSCRVRPLLANCRNTEAIAMFANRVGLLEPPDWYDPLLVLHRSDESHPEPPFHFYENPEDQAKQVLAHVLRLIDSGVPAGEVVVLSANRQQSCAGHELLRGLLSPYTLQDSSKVRYDTIHHFKGLESYCVIVTDIDKMPTSGSPRRIRELLYTAITRAVFRLDCFANTAIRAELQPLAGPQ